MTKAFRITVSILLFSLFFALSGYIALGGHPRKLPKKNVSSSPSQRQHLGRVQTGQKEMSKFFPQKGLDQLPISLRDFQEYIVQNKFKGLIREDHEDAANQMRTASPEVPVERLKYFAAYSNPDGLSVTGWTSFIESVDQLADGQILTLRVTPRFSNSAITSAHLYEKYFISNGQARLLEVLPGIDPLHADRIF